MDNLFNSLNDYLLIYHIFFIRNAVRSLIFSCFLDISLLSFFSFHHGKVHDFMIYNTWISCKIFPWNYEIQQLIQNSNSPPSKMHFDLKISSLRCIVILKNVIELLQIISDEIFEDFIILEKGTKMPTNIILAYTISNRNFQNDKKNFEHFSRKLNIADWTLNI